MKFPDDLGKTVGYMGGFGSGNRQQGGRLTVGQCLQLDVEKLKTHGLFDNPAVWAWRWSTGSTVQVDTRNKGFVTLQYSTAQEEPREYNIRLEAIPQHLGGKRDWFICPSLRCNRRCKTVYLRGGYFLCRKCQRLGYLTEQASKSDYPHHQIEKIRARLGWAPGYLNGYERKPKGMHWKTYNRLISMHQMYELELNAQLASFLYRLREEK